MRLAYERYGNRGSHGRPVARLTAGATDSYRNPMTGGSPSSSGSISARIASNTTRSWASYFCSSSARIRRGDKAFDVHANTYHLDADVVPCIEHRWYLRDPPDDQVWYVSGVNIRTDSGKGIENCPEQHYKKRVRKKAKVSPS